jgi:hypothetical protein
MWPMDIRRANGGVGKLFRAAPTIDGKNTGMVKF